MQDDDDEHSGGDVALGWSFRSAMREQRERRGTAVADYLSRTVEGGRRRRAVRALVAAGGVPPPPPPPPVSPPSDADEDDD